MATEFLTVDKDAQGEITEKKSRFIATVHHVESEEEALDFINTVKKTCWDARHNCFAYVIGTDQPTERANDDGEPSRTAGLPILETIKAAGLTNVCIVVTRYFGGILLGTGPLARAYRDAASAAVSAAVPVRYSLMHEVLFTVDYDLYGKLRYEAERLELITLDTEYSDKVTVKMALSDDSLKYMQSYLNDVSGGTAAFETNGKTWVKT